MTDNNQQQLLIVEDDQRTAKLLLQRLRSENYNLYSAVNVNLALKHHCVRQDKE